MEQVKEAFNKVKQDIDSLKNEVSTLSKGLIETRESLVDICEVLKTISKKIEEGKKEIKQDKIEETPHASQDPNLTYPHLIPQNYYTITLPFSQVQSSTSQTPTDYSKDSTDKQHSSTSNTPQKPQKAQNYSFSIGNEGVPTDRQTDQQTDQQTDKGSYNQVFPSSEEAKSSPYNLVDNSINNAAKILDSLDTLKKEIRLKFKRLTDQEFLVFSTMYQVSEESGYTDYKNLSEKLNLTESSIRDYIGRLIKKGIPVDKVKINNKTIHLSISPDLKKIASLPTLLQLRSI